MFGISLPELIIIFAVALMVLGPKGLPEAARKIGKIMAELKKASDSVRREFYNSVYHPINESIDQSTRNLRTISQEIKGDVKDTCEEKKEET